MLTGSFRKSAKSSLHSRKKDYVARSLAAISHALAFQHDVFHEIQTATVHYNAEIDRGDRAVSNIQTMKLPQGSEMNPANSVKPEERRGSKMAVTNLSNLPRPTSGQAYI